MGKICYKRVLCSIVAVMMLAFLFYGCSGQTTGDNTSKSTSQVAKTDTQVSTAKATSASTEMKPEDYKGKVTIWGWDAAGTNQLLPYFNRTYKNIKVEYVPVAYGDLVQKVRTSLASSMDLPDVCWMESGVRGSLIDLDCWDNLEGAPYNFDKSTIFSYLLPILSNAKGELVAIDWGGAMAGLAYRKEIAKKYLGTDDPAELQKLLPNWNSIIEKGKEIRAKSGNKVFMFACDSDVHYIFNNSNPEPFVNGDKLNFDNSVGKTLDFMTKLVAANLLDTIDVWSPAYYASFKSGNYMFYPCPPWMLNQFATQDPDGVNKWGLMIPPGGGFNYGGTAYGISKTSKNKEAAWQFVNWFLLSDEGSRLNKDINKQWSCNKSLYESKDFSEIKDTRFGDQNLGDVWFNQIAPNMKLRPLSKYDSVINETLDLVDKDIKLKKIDYTTAAEEFKKEIKSKVPELIVD